MHPPGFRLLICGKLANEVSAVAVGGVSRVSLVDRQVAHAWPIPRGQVRRPAGATAGGGIRQAVGLLIWSI